MSLAQAGDVASSSLAAIATQIDLTSRNIAGVNTANYSRKLASVVTDNAGSASVDSVTRAANATLFQTNLDAIAKEAAGSPGEAALSRLDDLFNLSTVSATEQSTSGKSPASGISKLSDSLKKYAASPKSESAAGAVLGDAQSLVQSLNDASVETQKIRSDADASIATSVKTINELLSKFQEINSKIVADSKRGVALADNLDARDAILSDLSKEIGVKTVSRANNGLALYTDSGVTLFETTPRVVSFSATQSLGAGAVGKAVFIDGVAVTGASAGDFAIKSGNIAGQATLRDKTAVVFQKQLDEIARGLVQAFSETNQNDATIPASPGLFTYEGATVVPPPGDEPGIAAKIKINATVDPAQGGNLTLLRDGGVSHPTDTNYIYNTNGSTGFTDRINQLDDALTKSQPVDAKAELGANASVLDFANASIGWLADHRKRASDDASYQSSLVSQTKIALSNDAGVNLDAEMARLLTLENSYQATARLLSTVNAIYSTLFEAIKA